MSQIVKCALDGWEQGEENQTIGGLGCHVHFVGKSNLLQASQTLKY